MEALEIGMIKEIYEKVVRIEREVEEIKEILIGEEKLTEEEEKELEESLSELKRGEVVSEEEIRKVLKG